jgi:hypothetical protein
VASPILAGLPPRWTDSCGELPHRNATENLTEMHRIRIAGIAGLLALVVAACSSQASTTPSPSTTPIPSEPPASSAAATPSAAQSAGTEASASASAGIPGIGDFHAAPDLEATLPDQLAGQPLQKLSFAGDAFSQMGSTRDQEFKDFLERLNAQPEDISVAVAGGEIGTNSVSVAAFRVKGANGDTLETEFRNSMDQDASQKLNWSDETIGGKSVVTTTDPADAEQGKVYVYAKGDTIFFVTSPDASIATEAITQLP